MDPASAATALIASYYAHFNAQEWDGMTALLTEDVAHDINQGGREVGRDTFRTFLARMERSYRERLTGIRICASADGSHAAAEYVVHGEYLATDEGLPPAAGQRYLLPGGAFFDIHDGRISRVSNAYNLQDWLRQIGA